MSVSTLDVPAAQALVQPRERFWLVTRWVVFAAYVVFFVWSVRTHGFPFDRERMVLWVAGSLAISCLGRPWKRALWLVIDWLPIPIVFLVYDYSRAGAENLGMPVHVKPQIWAEKALFVGKVPTVHLQDWFYNSAIISTWQAGVTVVYVSHFVAPFIVAGVLWARNRLEWFRFISRFVVASFLGVAFFVVAPTAPPWMASQDGHIGPVERIVHHGWSKLNLSAAENWFKLSSDKVNPVAAIPSLHAGYSILIAMFFWSKVPARFRGLLLIHPIAMTFTIVYGGEHYLVDALAGWLLIAVSFWLCTRAERWWSQRPRATVRIAVDSEV